MRLALLGPIAWRTPPRALRPVGADHRAAGRRPRGARRRRDAVRHARLDHARPPGRGLRAPVRGGPRGRRAHLGGAARRARAQPLGGVRPDPQPPRLAAAGLRGARPRPDGHDGPRVLLAAHPAGLPALGQRVRLDLRRRPGARPRLRRDGPPRRRRRHAAVLGAARATELVCFGRIHPDKGTARAIEIARRAERPLRPVRAGAGRALLRRGGRAARRRRPRALPRLGRAARSAPRCWAAARCLLHPIAFAEPFGLSVVESMLCGTPVVAYARGSMPELLEDGVTGVLAARRRSRRWRASDRAVALRPCRLPTRRPSAASPPTAWSTTTSTSTKRCSVTDSASLFTRHPGNPML